MTLSLLALQWDHLEVIHPNLELAYRNKNNWVSEHPLGFSQDMSFWYCNVVPSSLQGTHCSYLSTPQLFGGRSSIYLTILGATSSRDWKNCCPERMMDFYFKTMTLNKDCLYLYELKGYTKHLNIFINKEDLFIAIPSPQKSQVLICY